MFSVLSLPPVDNSSYLPAFANWRAVMAMKQLRQDRSWSQEQLADLSGLSLRTVQRIEADNKAGYESLRALAFHPDRISICSMAMGRPEELVSVE